MFVGMLKCRLTVVVWLGLVLFPFLIGRSNIAFITIIRNIYSCIYIYIREHASALYKV